MLTNASITRIDRKTDSLPTGAVQITAGDAIDAGGLRCFVDKISTRQRYALAATIEDADQSCFVLRSAIAAAGESMPAAGDHLMILLDGSASEAYLAQIVTTADRQLPGGGGNSHLELYLRRLPVHG